MDEPWKHYAKRNKSDTKGQILYDSTFVKHLEKVNSQKQKVEQRLPGAEWRENEKLLINGYRVSVWGDEKVSRIVEWLQCESN